MPGHKFGSIADLAKLDLTALDNTEVIGMDNLYEAEGVIKEAMTLMAGFYNAKHTLFLTNGSTAGILASILATCKEGDYLIVARNAHHSVWSGLILAGVIPIYITPEYHIEEDLIGEIKVQTVEAAMEQYPEAKGVLIVSPTYEGVVSNIKAIAESVHKANKILIVDEAHGAHFILGEDFPASSISQGADLVINSMHKTLPALTQSGLLHIGSEKIELEKVVASLRMIQTSSPSYIMMGVMDYIRAYISTHRNLIKEQYIDVLLAMRQRLKRELKQLKLIDKESYCYDRSKLVISTKKTNITGYELAQLLDTKYNIIVEAALETYIILITTMADKKEHLMRLEEALITIDKESQGIAYRQPVYQWIEKDVVVGKKPRDVYNDRQEWIRLEESIGKVSASNLMLYPPGIPIICVGERISQEHLDIIIRFKDKIQGIRRIENQLQLHVVCTGIEGV